jgi:branched-chain amino acid aminotransferase
MSEGTWLNYNGKLYKSDELLISPNNRSFRYGDGCFETMKMIDGRIVLQQLHFERLFASLDKLQFQNQSFFNAAYLLQQVEVLAKKNELAKLARVRLMVFRGDGGLYETENLSPNYLIQTWELNEANNKLNENGLVIDIYNDAKKVCDDFSQIKSNNYLCYAMAALWAKKNKLNDALVLNNFNGIADATIANVFIVKDGIVKTPALTEGCVGGVMRRYLLECMRKENMTVEETHIDVNDIYAASEMFLTNAAYGIRWVQHCGDKNYQQQIATVLFKNFIVPIL